MITTAFVKKFTAVFSNNNRNIFIIIFVALLLRLPLYHTVYWRTNDATEYINLARNIANGEGFVQSLKFRYVDNYPVITSAFHGRTSFLSIILAGIIKLGGNEYTMQLFSLSLGIINSLLIYILAKKWTSAPWSFVVGLFAAANPNLLINSRLILTEPLFTSFILLTLIVCYTFKEKVYKYLIAGIVTSLAYLTRAEGIFLIPLLTTTVIQKPKRFGNTLLFLLSFVIVSFPFFYGNYHVNGNPLYSYQNHLYRMKSFGEIVGGYGYGKIFPSPFDFVASNTVWILKQEVHIFLINSYFIIKPDFFGPILLYLLILFLPSTWKKFSFFYLYAFVIFLVYLSAWSAFFEPSRHFTAPYLLLLIPLASILQHLSKKTSVVLLIIAFTLGTYLIYDVHRIYWARTIDPSIDWWSKPSREVSYQWIRSYTNKYDIISTTSPEMINLHTNRPAIRTPLTLNKQNFSSYIHQYHITYLLIEGGDADLPINNFADLKATFPDTQQIYHIRKF